MDQFSIFSSGLELANLVVSSDLLHKAWDKISDFYEKTHISPTSLPLSVQCQVHQHSPNAIIIAFVSSPTCKINHLQGDGGDLVSSATLREQFPLLEFISTKVNPSFSLHKIAVILFASLLDDLCLLKDKIIDNSNSNLLVIITGYSLGGSVASLFTLWLLNSISPKAKRPLCITFGSPLIGDEGFQRAISERSTWNSCFLHVVSSQDPIPKFLASPTSTYKTFGTFLLCSESDCSCFEEPESILEIMRAMSSETVGQQDLKDGSQLIVYDRILEYLKHKAFFRGISMQCELGMNPLHQGIALQLAAVGVIQSQMNDDMNTFITKIEGRVRHLNLRKRNVFDPTKKLNDMKINMAYLEWYKKVTMDQGGYYDSYKNASSRGREEIKNRGKIIVYQKKLTSYWQGMVKQAEERPQKEWAAFRIRWLYAGTNYRRMVEPLDIAEYYNRGNRNYISQGRSKHYLVLEQWLNDDKPAAKQQNKVERKKACSLTEDSCFWAHVEEALISCSVLKDERSSPEDKESSRKNLIKFEGYVMDLILNYSVSPEIFLEKSSFMHWWREYETIKGISYSSPLSKFMKNDYRRYT